MLPRALVATATLALVLSGAIAHATSPGRNGRIAFMRRDGNGHWQIWVADSHLETAKKLTNGPADSGWAVWSPEDKKLAFDSNRTDPNPNDSTNVNDVFTMNADGSGTVKLTDSTGSSGDAAWSPDGSLIAFDSDRGHPSSSQGIYTMRPDGTQLRRVTTLPPGYEYDLAPRFSPDGRRLVFTRYRGKDRSETAALFVVNLDGSRLRRLTSLAIHAGDADWSPNGKRIVFEAYPNPDAYGDVYVVGADGRNLKNLTRNPAEQAGSADPVWSPDGTKILFLDNRRVKGIGKSGLATMNADGSARAFVSRHPVESHQPDWEVTH